MAGIDSILAATSNKAPYAADSAKPNTPSATETKKNEFLQLLVAQLKGQNPLDPMDGTQFVSQLAQFSSLEELTSIHSALDNVQQYLKPAQQTAADTTRIF